MTAMVPATPDDSGPPDLEGCESDTHCHRKRSSRQENAFTPEGRRRACHRPAGWGTNHVGTGGCKLHGGNTRQGNILGAREAAAKAVRTLGLPLDIGPAEALLQEVQRTAGHVAWLGQQVAAIEKGDLVWGMVEELIQPDIRNEDGRVINADVSGKYRAAPSVWYEVYRRERQHLADVCDKALKAGVSERMVRLAENVGDTYVTFIEGVLGRLDLTADQMRAVPAAVVSELQKITSVGGEIDGK